MYNEYIPGEMFGEADFIPGEMYRRRLQATTTTPSRPPSYFPGWVPAGDLMLSMGTCEQRFEENLCVLDPEILSEMAEEACVAQKCEPQVCFDDPEYAVGRP